MRSASRLTRPVALALSVAALAAACATSPTATAPASTAVTATGTASTSRPATTDPEGTTGSTRPRTTSTTRPTGGSLLDPITGANSANPLSAEGGRIGRDESFPELGHPGYDVSHYDLDLTFDPATGQLGGTARLDVIAVDPIHEIVLDLQGLTVSSATVDGDAATVRADPKTLTVELPGEVATGATFQVAVNYKGQPHPVPTDALGGIEVGWHTGAAGSVVMSEPEGASSWYPVNNHPLDKATYTIAVNVPKPLVAISNGRLDATDDLDDTRTFHWVMDKPMANYLATVITGDFEEDKTGTVDGVAYSSWIPKGAAVDPTGLDGANAVASLAEKLGPFPFDTYGAVVYTEDFAAGSEQTRQFIGGVALEAQGRSLYAEHALDRRTFVHETAHQWMGDNVSLTDWSHDIWWIEGFARFAETAVAAGNRKLTAGDFAEAARSCGDGTAGDIPRAELFSSRSYSCGALVFYALYKEVGADAFWSILREFNSRFRYSNASTDDLILVASTYTERDLGPFFRTWLFAPERPPLP